MYRLIRSKLGWALGVLAAALLLGAPGLAAQNAQNGQVTGRVTHGQSGQTVPSAQVFIAELDIGVLTQQNGSFLLPNVPAGVYTLTVQRIGYRSATRQVEVRAGETVVSNFRITEEALKLDEIVITGTAGGTQRRALGNSIEVLSASDVVRQAPITSIQSLMSARTPGLRFDRSDGQVGGGSGITIRGVSSVSLGTQPLIYVDGIRVQNDNTVGPSTGSSSSASALNDLNLDDIESIEVIKGPSAATLYGTEASAGVIQIITKRGAVGAPVFEVAVTQGANFMRDPQGTLGTQYACAVAATQCPQDKIIEYRMYKEASDYLRGTGRFAGVGLGRDTDLFQYGHDQRYNVSVTGGVEQVRYYAGLTLSDQTGVVDYNTNNQASMRANVSVLLGADVNLDLSMGYTQGETRFATIDEEGGVWHQLVWSRGANLPGVRSPRGSGFLGFQERFPEAYERTNVSREYSRFTGSATASHTVGEWFRHRVTLGIDKGASTDREFIPGESDFPNAPTGSLRYGRPLDENLTFDYSATGQYALTESLGTKTSVGARFYRRFRENVENFGSGFPTTIQSVIDQTEFGNRQVAFTSIENRTLGFFVQQELSWKDRIFLTGALAADDNSAFGANFDVQYYPNVQASWVISDESFWKVDFINSLRLRGAWGKAGRQPDTFASQTLYTTFLGPDGNGLVPATAGNPDIGPEVSTEVDVGFEIAMFDDRLSSKFSLYRITTDDMLVDQSLAPSTGLTGTRDANLGQMKTRGWEASIDARLYRSESVAFDLTVSGDYTTNEITALGEDILPTGNYQLGWPFPNVATDYFLVSAQMNPAGTALDPTTAMCDAGREVVPGGGLEPGGSVIPCRDFAADGILLGPAYPNYSFHIAPTLTLFQNLQLFALAEGQYGRWLASVDAQYACGIYRNCRKAVERTDPLFLAGNLAGPYGDDRYQGRFPADYWKLRQLGARYSLPRRIAGRLGASRMSISVSANNLWRLWQASEYDLAGNPIYDPEYAINGSDPQSQALWEMPSMASINATLRVTF
jgi:TonB-linked SusC/RagA family outer membrane protein